MAKKRKTGNRKTRTDYRSLAIIAQTWATLQKSGVPILDCMDITADLTDNAALARAIREARGHVREGTGLTAPLRETGMFPRMAIQMIATGEETGTLDDMLARIGNYYLEAAEGRGADEITITATQLAAMLEAGLPLVQSLAILGENTEGALGKVLNAVSMDVAGGAKFYDALAGKPRFFDKMFVSMVKAGETGENLAIILKRLSKIREFIKRAKRGKSR